MTTQQTAKLRVCASCEWVYHLDDCPEEEYSCPRCGFVSYEEIRSGTWSTIRYAKKMNVCIRYLWPEG